MGRDSCTRQLITALAIIILLLLYYYNNEYYFIYYLKYYFIIILLLFYYYYYYYCGYLFDALTGGGRNEGVAGPFGGWEPLDGSPHPLDGAEQEGPPRKGGPNARIEGIQVVLSDALQILHKKIYIII